MIKRLYKYRNFSNPYLENIIRHSSLYFASIDSFNDPFDCKLSFRQKYSIQEMKTFFIEFKKRNIEKNISWVDFKKKYGKKQDFIKLLNDITQEMISSLGVLSLSKNYNNILMWSHYSESHTGLVFEFSPKNINDENSCFHLGVPIEYSEIYEELSYVNDVRTESQKLILTKYKDWEYEEEYRCISLDYQGEKEFDKDELTGIIFGVKASQMNIDKIKRLCHEYDFHHVEFKQAVLEKGSFKLSFKKI